MFQVMPNLKQQKNASSFFLTDNLFEIKFFPVLALFLHHEIALSLYSQYSCNINALLRKNKFTSRYPSASSYAHSPSPSLPAVELQFAKVKIEKKIRCLCEVCANMHLCVLEGSF